jgi:hypothetical protein
VSARLDWPAFVSRFYPGSARHDFRVLKAYDAYRKSLPAEQSDGSGDAEALGVWEEEGGAAQVVTAGPRTGRSSS